MMLITFYTGLLEETVSQIFDIGPSSYFMTKKG